MTGTPILAAMRRQTLLAMLLLACGPKPGTASTTAPQPTFVTATLVFEGVRLFDGERWHDETNVLVDGSTIVAVGPDITAPPSAQRIAGEGMTLLPGLIDAHTHVQVPDQLSRAAVFGVTTEIDMFTLPATAEALRKPAAAGTPRAALRSAGILATAPGGHGTEYGFSIPTLTGPEQAKPWVDARVAEGSDFIKIVYDDGHAFGGDIPTLDVPTLTAVIEAAHAHQLLAVVHVSAQKDALTAIEAGADGLAHLFLDQDPGDAFVSAAAEHDVFVTDTLAVLFSVCDGTRGGALAEDPRIKAQLLPAEHGALSRGFPGELEASCEHALATTRKLSEAGVTVLASTDAPNPGTVHGASLHDELALLVEAGLTPTQALQAATAKPAAVFGLDDRGRIAEGMRADLLLVEGDPSTDILATRHVQGVWTGGNAVDLETAEQQAATQWKALNDARRAPPPAGMAAGLIADFESGEARAEFGAGWQGSTDAMRGGASTVELDVIEDGPDGSPMTMRIRGTIDGDSLPNAWAGAMFFPGPSPMSPANLTSKPTLEFQAQGDGPMVVMIFAEQLGFMPAMTRVEIGAEWGEYSVDLRTLVADPYDVTGIFFGGPPKAGAFTILLDDVQLK